VHYIVGSMMIMCGGSPLFHGVFLLYYVLLFHVGEIHRGGIIYYSRSPLSDPVFVFYLFFVLLLLKMSGRFTG